MGRYEKKQGKSAFVMWVTADRNSGIYGLPKAYVLYQANSGKVAIHLEEYRMNGGKGSSMGNRRKCTSGWADIQDSTDR